MNNKRIAVYPGTFDPITVAHLDVIRRAASIFDFVYVAVLTNKKKKPSFSVDERMRLITKVTEDIGNCKADSFEGLTVEYAKSVGACAIIRGVRTVADFENESLMYEINHKLNEEIETVCLFSKPVFRAVSSSAVREICAVGGDPAGFVPDSILQEVKKGLRI